MLHSPVRSIQWPAEETSETLEQQHQSKAAGPDRISLRVLQHWLSLFPMSPGLLSICQSGLSLYSRGSEEVIQEMNHTCLYQTVQ